MSGNTMKKAGQSEACFLVKTFKKGWEVAKPFHHSQGYDYVIRQNTKWETVQVKSAFQANDRYKNKHLVVSIRRTGTKQSKPYAAGDFDLLAVVYEDKIWLIDWYYIKHIRSNIRIEQQKYVKFLI